eukprot:TRINITY_DN8231_c0_g1_i1.p1 TRINITY_DN8231_c0_g1~~TRINITY_DN8231_c0_g1_i1.p1  ORF type:complete len:429 (+),score=169.95 TRINITY_DN8231_c0_g1_i1:93-1379(+)
MLAVVAFGVLLSTVACSAQLPPQCHGTPNLYPIQDAPPTFVKSVPNGKLYTVGQGDETISLVHVFGTPYEMGYAYGQLLPKETAYLINNMVAHLQQEVEQSIDKYIGKDMGAFVAKFGLSAALDLTYELTKDYSPSYFFEEFAGLANATGLSYWEIVRINMLPELVKAGCSIYGAWGQATATGGMFQLRALDWDTSGPMQTYPVITIYHPAPGYGHPFANIAWAGFLSSITGLSSARLGMSEKVTDHDFGTSTRIGIPFNFLMRDVLQWDANLGAAITRMANARRTCNIWLGTGDGNENRANLFQYSHSDLVVIDDTTVIQYPSNDTKYTHPLLKNVVYWGVNQQCYSYVLTQQHGNITAENTIQHIIPISETGNLHANIYDLANLILYTANARAGNETGPDNAYDRPFVRVDVGAAFAELPPTIKIA